MKKRKDLNKQEAFLEFKGMEEAKMLEESIRDNRHELKEIKHIVKDLTEKCNISKKNIDSVKHELDKKQDERKQGFGNQLNGVDEADIDNDEAPQEIIDEEELAMLTHMKDLKKAYRQSFQELKTIKAKVHAIS
jgi:septal ring factor EnvC (AmiA/AmiB activator)